MAGARITLKLDASAFSEGVRRVEALMRNSTPLMHDIGVAMVTSTRDRMDAGVDPQGTPWTPLNPAYAAVKRGPGILRESLKLQQSITFQSSNGRVVWGTNRVYAAIHQFGGKIVPKNARALVFRLGDAVIRAKSVTMPARPYLGLSEADQGQIIEVAKGAIRRALVG